MPSTQETQLLQLSQSLQEFKDLLKADSSDSYTQQYIESRYNLANKVLDNVSNLQPSILASEIKDNDIKEALVVAIFIAHDKTTIEQKKSLLTELLDTDAITQLVDDHGNPVEERRWVDQSFFNLGTALNLAIDSNSFQLVEFIVSHLKLETSLDYEDFMYAVCHIEFVISLKKMTKEEETEFIQILNYIVANSKDDLKCLNTKTAFEMWEEKKKCILRERLNIQPSFFNSIVAEDYTNIVKFLAEHIPVNGIDLALINLVAKKGYTEVVRLFLERGPKINLNLSLEQGPNGNSEYTILHSAAEEGHTDIVRLLIEHGVNKEPQNELGYTPLHLAALKGHTNIVRLLIEHGVNKESRTNFHGLTPLHCAAEAGHTDIVRLLIEHGANKESRTNFHGLTPLHCAAEAGHTDIVRLLIEHGANKESRTKFEERPLHCAALKGYTDIVRLLIEHGANKESRTNFEETPLHCAALKGYTDIVRLLIAKGALTDIRNKKGESPLDIAVKEGKTEIINLFAQSNIFKTEDLSHIHIDAEDEKGEVIEKPIEADADINIQSKVEENIPLDIAVDQNNQKVVVQSSTLMNLSPPNIMLGKEGISPKKSRDR